MALSGYGDFTDINGVIHQRVYWRAVADVPNNRYKMYCKLWLSRDSTWATHDATHRHRVDFYGGGGSVYDTTMSIYVRDPGNTIGDYDGYQRDSDHHTEFEFWVNCDPDGTCDFTLTGKLTCTAYFGSSYFPTNGISYAYADVHLDQIPRGSVINSVSNFNLEDTFSVSVTKYSSSFTDTLAIKYSSTTIKTITGYTSGMAINFSDTEILTAYNALGSNMSGTFTFTTTTKSGSTTIGTDSETATGTVKGTMYLNNGGTWERAVPHLNVGETWKRCIAYFHDGDDWQRGIG